MRQRRTALMMVAACLLAGCSTPADESKRPWRVSEGATADIGPDDVRSHDAAPDERPAPPSYIAPPGEFAWAPDDLPIYFHTVEESERTVDEWGPYFEPALHDPSEISHRPDDDRVGWRLKIIPDPRSGRHDIRLRPLGEGWTNRRRNFVGFGPPFTDDYLHMFECPYPGSSVYKIRDFILQCVDGGLVWNVFFLNVNEGGPYGDQLPESAPRATSDRMLSWWQRLHEAAVAFYAGAGFAVLPRLDFFIYSEELSEGVRSTRLVQLTQNPDPYGRPTWRRPRLWVPVEYCTEDHLGGPPCETP